MTRPQVQAARSDAAQRRLYRQLRRDVIARAVTAERWRDIVEAAIQDAIDGNRYAREWLAAWVVGQPRDEPAAPSAPDEPLEILVDGLAQRLVPADDGQPAIHNPE